jgi:Golgi SNAP receptor complex protein 1
MSHDNQHRPHQRSTILNFDQDDEDGDRMGAGIKEALIRESDHLTNSERLLDEQYDLAWRTRESLIHQRSAISSMRESLSNITGRFTLVNDLVRKIKLRKRRDTIIVAIVFSICLGLLLYHLIL